MAAASLTFDPYIFAGRRSQPVHTDYTASGEFVSTGISFDDLSRMHVQSHKQSSERRLPTPDWAVNDSKLQQLLVVFMEQRAGLRQPQPGTQQERLARAVEKLKSAAPTKIAVMKKLCQEYVSLKRSSPNDLRLRKLEVQIENLDTQLRHINRPAELVCGITYRYYRERLDSVGTGLALGIKPASVRQTLWRLHHTWARIVAGTLRQQRQPDRERIIALYKEGTNVPTIGRVVGCHKTTVRSLLIREGIYYSGPARRKLQRIARLYKAGKRVSEIARALGFPKRRGNNCVRDALKQAGLYRASRPKPLVIDRPLVISLYQQGKSIYEIAAAIGYQQRRGYNRLRKLLKEEGIRS